MSVEVRRNGADGENRTLSIKIVSWAGMESNPHLRRKNKVYLNLYVMMQLVPRRKHYISVIKTSQFMLYREIIFVCSQIHTKHINTLCGQKVEFCNVTLVVHIVTAGL
jgi:hypothetical protein